MDRPVGAVVATRRSQRAKRTPLDAGEFLLDIDAEILVAENQEKLEDEYEYEPVPDDNEGTQAGGQRAASAANTEDGAMQGMNLADLVASTQAPPKKKRGRPRKYPAAPVDVSQAPVVKRPRGRPRGSGKHQRAALARSLSVSMSLTTSSDAGADEHIAPLTGDQQHLTPPPAVVGPLDDRTPVSHARDALETPSNASQGSQASQEGRRRPRKGSRPSRGV